MAKIKIIWAFNPFQNNRKVFKSSVELLKAWTDTGLYQVEPTFVVSPAEAKVVLEFSVPARVRFQTVARRACLRALRGVRFPGLMSPKILVENHLTISHSAKALVDYARSQKAHKIVVGTQGRDGLDRLLLGSFAETLLYFAKIPVLLINPQVGRPASLKNILFASDFSVVSLKAFHRLVATAERHGAGILVYHCLPRPFRWAKQAAEFLFGRGMMSTGEYLRIEADNREKDAGVFLRYAEKHGVPVQLKIDETDKEISDAILIAAGKANSDLIAMVSQTGKAKTALLGSTTRGVIRKAKTPVWVMRPQGQ